MQTPQIHPILEDYTLVMKEETRLYQRGKREQWDADSLPWEIGTSLDSVRKAAGARILSTFLYGEQTSMLVASQLIPLARDMEARFYLSTQLLDETRHVEAFSRYISLLGKIQPPNSNISELADKLITIPTIEEKMIGLHLLVEGLAQEVFHAAARSIDDPLLQHMLNRIVVDESRHVAFGTVYLKKLVSRLDPEAKEALLLRQTEFGMLIAGLVSDEAEACVQFGLDLEIVTERAIKIHFHRLQEIGLME
jgi:ribonucleotide reductase beta subunit family protein with ferritin-like domain